MYLTHWITDTPWPGNTTTIVSHPSLEDADNYPSQSHHRSDSIEPKPYQSLKSVGPGYNKGMKMVQNLLSNKFKHIMWAVATNSLKRVSTKKVLK